MKLQKAFAAAVLVLAAGQVLAAGGFDRTRFRIGAYSLKPYAQDEEHVRDLKECGIDFLFGLDPGNRPMLDLFAKYGIDAIVNGVVPLPGPPGKGAGEMERLVPLERIDGAAARFRAENLEHPAIRAINAGDEPSARDFRHLGAVIAREKEHFPEYLIYLNIYPNYARIASNSGTVTAGQLGVGSYEEYVREYCRYVPLDYLSFDFYVYSAADGHLLPKLYSNLDVVARACRRTGRSLWFFPQVNSNVEKIFLSEDQLRFQGAVAMAFGAELLHWACWCKGWWYNNVLDQEGRRTEQYEKLRKVNAELHRIGAEYMKFRNIATHFVGFAADSPEMADVITKPVARLSTPWFGSLGSETGAPFVVGEMTARDVRDRERAMFVCAADDPFGRNPREHVVAFTPRTRDVRVYGPDGPIPFIRRADGSCAFPLRSSSGALIVAGDPKPAVKVIFDTDMYTDFDDVGALGCLHALADAGEAEILATVVNTPDCLSAAVCEIVNRWYGRQVLPVGCVKDIRVLKDNSGNFSRYGKLCEAYANWIVHRDSSTAPDANDVMRKALAAQPDGSVVICSVGFLTNLRRLVESGPDVHSPLSGLELVRRKVRMLSLMACKHPSGREHNVRLDPESARIALEAWPTPIVFTDYDFGVRVHAGRSIAESRVAKGPVRDVFDAGLPPRGKSVPDDPGKVCETTVSGRAAWDQIAVLAAVRDPGRYFTLERGDYRITDEQGTSEWKADGGSRNVRIAERMPVAEVGRVIDELMLRPPRKRQ